jgi:diacylglycerol O-acyltransferase
MKPESTFEFPHRMAATDAMFWYAESALPIFRPIIAGLYILDRAVEPAAVDLCIDCALDAVPRLRQRVLEMPLHIGLPEWIDDEHFDQTYHVRHLSLPAKGGQRALLELTSSLFAAPLDRERPLWEAYYIEGLDNGRSALFWKMHHALVDGVGSLAILNGLTQPDSKGPHRHGRAKQSSGGSVSRPGSVARLARLAAHNARESATLATRMATLPLRSLRAPVTAAKDVASALRGFRGVLSDLTTPAVMDPLASNSSGLSRRFDIVDVSIARLKAIKKPLGVSLNDVVLAALADTLGRYHRRHRARVDVLNCMVPMNLRGKDEKDVLGNRVGNFTIVLPVSERNTANRITRIVEQTRAAKADKRGASYPLLVETLTMIPGAAFRWLARQSIGRINVACTNVPGVAEPRFLGGASVEAVYPFASVVEGTPLVMALLSYGGMMNIGIDTDPEAIPNPHQITELFEKSLVELERYSQGRAKVRRSRSTKATAHSTAPPTSAASIQD